MAKKKTEPSGMPVAPASDVQQQALLQFAVSQSSAVFYIADIGGYSPVRFISSNVEAITGHKVESFLSEDNYGYERIHADDLPRYKHNIGALKERGTLTHEYRFAVADGSFRWFRDELRMVDGHDSEFVGCMVDISAERENDERVAESVEMFKRVLDASPIPMSMVHFDNGRIMFENPAIHAVFREDPNSSSKTAGAYDIDPSERERYLQLLRENGRVDSFEIRFRREDGSEFVGAHSARLIEYGGETVVVTGIVDLTEQKRRETALRLANETLEDAIESLSEGFVLYDSDDRLVMCNSQYREFHGDNADLLVPGAFWPDVTRARGERGLFTEAEGNFDDWLRGQIALRGSASREVFPSGDGRWFEYSHRKTRQNGFVSVWRDITEHIAMEQELRESEELIRRVLEACPVPVRMWEPVSGRVIYESPACSLMFGRDATTVNPSQRHSMYMDLADRETYLARLHEKGAVDNLEMHLRHADGSTFWASVSARLIEFKGETVVVSALVDLSERKAMEEALRQSEEHFRSIVEGHPVPVWMVDIETAQILYESPAAAQMVGREWPSSEPAYTTDHVPSAPHRDEVNNQLRKTGSMIDQEFELKRADGTKFWASVNDRLITYGGREISITSFVDLTERHEAAAELARQRERLHQNEKLSALGELLAGVSHELNNPLSVLVGQALMLQEVAEDDQTAHRAERIAKAADRCARIVKTFLAMARQEQRAPKPLELSQVLESAMEVAGYTLNNLEIDVKIQGLGGLPRILGEEDQLVQVFTNLIVNAQHALQDTDGERRLRIRASHRRTANQVVIKFKDNGPGIPKDIRSRIFEPLYTTKDVGAGTGMGLALCHRIVEAHDGSIELERASGPGASFAVRLPCLAPEDESAAGTATAAADGDRCAILIVDDEPDVAGTLADLLENDGHRVEVVSSGASALGRIQSGQFEIILSDVRMPGMDGPALYKELRASSPQSIDGLAFITGDTLSPRVRSFLDGAGRPFIEKPIMPQDARELVDMLIRARRGLTDQAET